MLLISSVRFAVRLSVAVACALGMGFCRAEPLRTVAEVRALSAKEMDEQRPVELEGLVIARNFNGSILLQDKTGSFIVEYGRDVVADPGDKIRVKGITFVDHVQGILQESVRLLQCVRLGSGPVPMPKDVNVLAFSKGETNLRVDERTRLAVELHDSISQNLTGASFQIDAAESMMAENPENAAKCLANARVVLGSCRRELRDCISDLRDRTLESTMQARHCARPCSDVSVRPRSRLISMCRARS